MTSNIKSQSSNNPQTPRAALIVLGLVSLAALLRWLWPERPVNYTGPRALLDLVFAIALLAVVLLLAAGVGQKLLRWLKVTRASQTEWAVFALPVGLGVLAYGIMALGLVGILKPWLILLWLALVGLLTWREWAAVILGLPGWQADVRRQWRWLSIGKKLFAAIIGLIFVITLLMALTPAWDYDGLMYHLFASQQFLQAERIILLPDVWQANNPFAVQMLYVLGLGVGSDVFAKLVHLSFGVILLLATFSCGQRYVGGLGGWLAVAMMLGMPIVMLVSSWAYADMAWAVYQFLALYALLLWVDQQQRGWLVAAALLAGLALGSKYLALGNGFVLGLAVLWLSRKQGWRGVLANGAWFGGVSLLVGAPWYLKNLVLTGNPVYPFVWGGPGWDATRLDYLNAFLYSFSAGRSLLDYLLLPINIYVERAVLVTFLGGLEWPNLLFLLVLGYPVLPAKTKLLTIVAVITLAQFLIWTVGSQQIRFLMPLFPALSVLSTKVLLDLTGLRVLRRWQRVMIVGLNAGMIVVTFFSLISLVVTFVKPLPVIVGSESKANFLDRTVSNYSVFQYVQKTLPSQTRVMLMWDGRGYYCNGQCLPDAEQSQWTQLVSDNHNPETIAAELKKMGVTHLLFSVDDLSFISLHDPVQRHQRAAKFFLNEFKPACARVAFADDVVPLYRITCP